MHFLNEHIWSHPPVLFFVPEKFDFQCDLWQDVEHYTLQQAHITLLLIMQLAAETQLILQDVIHMSIMIHMSITKWTVVVLCHTEQHATHSLLQKIMFNIQPILNICKWIKSNTFWNINSYSLIEQYVTRKIWWFFLLNLSFLDMNSKWCNKCVVHYYFNKMYNAVCFLMKMINQ